MKFNYQARTKTGEVQSGIVEASSREAAVNLLHKYELYITLLEPVGDVPIYAKRLTLFEKVSRRDIVLFSRQLSLMFKSKVSLIESLQVLATQSKNPSFREKISELSEAIEGGTSFSNALAKYPDFFSPFYIAMVRAGESSGKLSESLEYLAEHLEREYHLTGKIKGALIYPVLILFIVILVMFLMIFFVIPQLSIVLEASGEQLPGITQFVISFADITRKFWWGIAILLFLIFFIIFQYRQTSDGRKFFDRAVLKIFGLGEFLKMIYVSRFAENLSTLISGGLPIAQALEITGEIVGNEIYKEVILKTRDEVRRGEQISSVLTSSSDIFPPVFSQMVMVGEKTGTLDASLLHIVNFYKREIDREIDNFLSVLEPVLILFLGLIVAGLMFAVLMPLYRVVAL
ncbi:MAG: type II secretion system F family protein [Candidatus Paceibacterota bacterium]